MQKVREKGADSPEIVVVTDTPTRRAWGEGRVMGTREMQVLARNLEQQGVRPSQVRFITPSGPLPEDAVGSERRIGEWLELHRADFLQKLQKRNPRLVIYLGKYAGRQYVGRQVKINTARGTLYRDAGGRLVLPLYSPRHVLRRPEVRDIFDTDIRMVGTLKAGGWDASIFEASVREARYRWVTDLGFLLDDPPDKLAADVETVGVEWYRGQRLLTVQYAWRKAESVIVPMDAAYIEGWREQYERELEALDPNGEDYQGEVGRLEDYIAQLPEGRVTAKVVRELKAQSRELLGNRRTKVVGHNLKFDIHALRNHDIHVANWYADTMQLAFAVDDNMESKDLDSCIRRWVPEMAGYADCVAMETEILTYDQRKVRADQLRVGDRLCAFTAETDGRKATRRKMAIGIVEGIQTLRRKCLCITTESGRQVRVSEGHLMLSKKGMSDLGGGWRWRKAKDLRVGAVLKPFPWEDPCDSREAGYVAGILDGEGWGCAGRLRIGYAQRPGRVLARTRSYLASLGVSISHSTDHRKEVPVANDTFDGHDSFKVLQKVRPVRLLEEANWEGAGLPTNGLPYDRIVAIDPAGEQDVIGLRTSTQTIIANGLLSHNSFNREMDKSRMDLTPPHLMRSYGCGDTDATLRLANVLVREARKDRANWNCFKRVQMPGLRAYVEVERVGFHLDKDALRDLERTLAEREAQLYREMIALVPPEVRRREMADPRHKGKTPEQILSFTRPDFIRECLFSERGLGLEPIVYTKTTARSSDPADRVASTSAKDHLGHFHGEPLVDKIIEFGSLNTMRTRYVGSEGVERRGFVLPLKSGKWPKPVLDALAAAGMEVPEARKPGTKPRRRIRVGTLREAGPDGWRIPYRGGRFLAGDYLGRLVEVTPDAPSGFWQYLSPEADDIHPSYFLHHAKTGRTNSRNPNGQNLPKHGPLAPAFRRIFRPTPGYLFLEGDLSQIELRLAAWMSGDPTMLHAYRTGQDLHALTAASTMGMPFEEFRAMKGSDDPRPLLGYSTMGEWFDHHRFLAKGINFGFIYGMWHTTFREYAKATFRIDVSPAEAERYRRVFFETYPGLENFHGQMKRFVGTHGYVRALHGALRRLPAIESDDEAVRKDTERQAINSPIQRFGSDLLVMALARLVRDAPPERLRSCGTIHDSMILEVREDYVEEGAQAVKFYMESNPLREWFGITPPIPLLADISGPSQNLASMTEMQVEAVAPPWYRVELDQ